MLCDFLMCGWKVLLNFLVFNNWLLFDIVKKSIIGSNESCFKIIELKLYVSGYNL